MHQKDDSNTSKGIAYMVIPHSSLKYVWWKFGAKFASK